MANELGDYSFLQCFFMEFCDLSFIRDEFLNGVLTPRIHTIEQYTRKEVEMKRKINKDVYSKLLREKWKYAKALADKDEIAKALYVEVGEKVSYYSFYYVLSQMRKLGLEGLPYIDMKTFNGWKQIGFKVMKGQHSLIEGITWVEAKSKKVVDDIDEEEKEEKKERKIIYPKVYHLFHRTQVEKIE